MERELAEMKKAFELRRQVVASMKGTNFIRVRIGLSTKEFTTYLVAQEVVPEPRQIPSTTEECDAFVVVLGERPLPVELANEIAAKIVRLPVDWVETFGPGCEDLHDRIDEASVSIGRQEMVGDGDPMTAWHADLSTLDGIVSFLRTGGLGSAETKLVVVMGPEGSAEIIARRLERNGHEPPQNTSYQ